MEVFLDKSPVMNYNSMDSMYKNKHIIVSIDSSKTNTAIAVWSRTYTLLNVIEINGASDKDVLDLIKEQRKFLAVVFRGAKLSYGGIEDIITKKEETDDGSSGGMRHHHSRYVITAVFISMIVFFQDHFDFTLTKISNQSWKALVLPPDLNRKDVYKGSVEYIREKYPKYIRGGKDDDAADAICIGLYMKMIADKDKSGTNLMDIPDEAEILQKPCIYRLYNENQKINKDVGVGFRYNEELTLEANARAIANRIQKGQLGFAKLDITEVTVEDIYNHCAGKFEEYTTKLTLVVKVV